MPTIFPDQSDVPEHEGPSASRSSICTSSAIRYRKPIRRSSMPHRRGACITRTSQDQSQGQYGARSVGVRHRGFPRTKQNAVLILKRVRCRCERWKERSRRISKARTIARRRRAQGAQATDEFRQWLEAEAPSKRGPSGVGKENYDWYMKHVHLVPYTWEQQVTLLRRELERARASLALEEFRNRKLPPLEPVANEAAVQCDGGCKTEKDHRVPHRRRHLGRQALLSRRIKQQKGAIRDRKPTIFSRTRWRAIRWVCIRTTIIGPSSHDSSTSRTQARFAGSYRLRHVRQPLGRPRDGNGRNADARGNV